MSAIRRCWPRTLGLLALFATGAGPLHSQVLPSATPESVGLSTERLGRLSRALQDEVDGGGIAGMVTLVARDGKVAYLNAHGVADMETGEALTPDHIFRIASFSKAIVSVAAMTLVEEGRLRLSDPVSRFIPAFADATVAVASGEGFSSVPLERPVTVRDLLTHTSGYTYGGGPAAAAYSQAGLMGWYLTDRDEPIRRTAERLAEIPLAAQPGTRWLYGYSTDILGAVLEAASGQALDRLVAERVLGPLGMLDTHFYLPQAKLRRLAAVHGIGRDGALQRAAEDASGQGEYLEGSGTLLSGGAGMLSTATDYARLLQMLLNGGELAGRRILSPTSVRLMTADHVGDRYPASGRGFGLGFEVLTDPGAAGIVGSVGAFGWGSAYFGTYFVDPRESLVAVFIAQLTPTGGSEVLDRFRTLVYQAVVEDRPNGPG